MQTMALNISMKKLAAVLFCTALVFIFGQFLIVWYADDDDSGNVVVQPEIRTLWKEEIIHPNGIQARSDMIKHSERMEHRNGNLLHQQKRELNAVV